MKTKKWKLQITLCFVLITLFSTMLALSSNPLYITPSGDYHIVKRGETLQSIARQYSLSIEKIKLFNNMTSDHIFIGQKIFLYPHPTKKQEFVTQRKIPKKGYHLVKTKESIHRIAKMYGLSVFDILDYNNLNTYKLKPGRKIMLIAGKTRPVEASKPTGKEAKPKTTKTGKPIPTHPTITKPKTKLTLPLNGTVTSEFGLRNGRPHKGIDISADKGNPIHAALKGKVVYSGTQHGYGNVIILEHDDNAMTVYAHNETNLVRLGEMVNKGQPIATVGQTGTASGPHLHFEYRIKGKAINPRKVLPEL
ncbi:MAG: M23 family metallopeptidase [Candidatus Cloacimonadota bacterium]|nr:M23 family metallopeptidase [Candidatus Cloacimonadota bacterium]